MTAPFVNSQERDELRKPDLALYLGLLPFLLLIAPRISFRLYPPSIVVDEPPPLLPVLNTTFLFLVSRIVSCVAMKSYLLGGLATILPLGCGVLTVRTRALAAGRLIGPEGPNVNVTIFNASKHERSNMNMDLGSSRHIIPKSS